MSRQGHKRSDKRQAERAAEHRRREKENRETERKRDREPEPARTNELAPSVRPPKQTA
jgi:hypothetical protein